MTRLAGPRIPVIGLAALLLSQAAMAGEDLPLPRAQAEPLPVMESSPSLRGPQFMQADKQGRVFLLDGDTLEIFQIVAGDKLASRGKLDATGSVEAGERAVLRQAVMSPAGDVWLLLDSTGKVRLFRSGKEKSLPPTDWIVTALAAPRGTPLLAVKPGQRASGRDVGVTDDPDHPPVRPPFLLEMGDSEWETLVQGDYFRLGETRASVGHEIRAGSEVWMATEPNGTIWIAYRNAYRLKRYSPLGKLKDEIVVGAGTVKWAERSAEDWKKLEAVAKENKFAFRRSGVSPVQETAVVRAMTLGRDGRVYLLVETPKGLALDRFDPDPARQVLERVLLSGIDSGRFTMAAGRHALYLAALAGNGGRWKLPWESLEAAKWELVEDVAINGQPAASADAPVR
jgi:hypothetical protein